MDLELNAEDAAKEKAVQKDLDTIKAYKQTFSTAEGKRVLFDLMNSCCFLKTTAIHGMDMIQYNEGRRSVLTGILTIIDKKEEDILSLLKNKNDIDLEYEL